MEVLAKQSISDEEQKACEPVNSAAAGVPAKKSSGLINLPKSKNVTVKVVAPTVPEADLIGDLVHEIENLKRGDAITRLSEFEDSHEMTYFKIGGVLSVIQKNQWFDPFSSLEEWVEKNTAMRRAKARALIQIYDAIANSGVTWAKVKHIEWTKLRAIAGVLKEDNADYWIGIASKHTKAEIIDLVKKHLTESAQNNVTGSAATYSKTFKLHADQFETINTAIERMKQDAKTSHDSVALECICIDYMSGQTLAQKLVKLEPKGLAALFTEVLNSQDKDTVEQVMKKVFASLVHGLAPELF